MPTCPECLELKPTKSFILRNDIVLTCFDCRKRERTRLAMRRRRAREKQQGSILATKARLDVSKDTQLAKLRKKRLKTRFGLLVSPHRARLNIMLRNPYPMPKTTRAIEARQRVIRLYEAALAKQYAMVDAGLMPPDILEFID